MFGFFVRFCSICPILSWLSKNRDRSNFIHLIPFCPDCPDFLVRFCPYYSILSGSFHDSIFHFVRFTICLIFNFREVGTTYHLHWCQKAPRLLGHGQRGWRSKQGQQIDLQIRRRRLCYTKSLRKQLLLHSIYSQWHSSLMAFWKSTLEHIPNAGYD